ncbi:unnamed protein product [Caenorhabditis nigoni]
MVQINVTLFSLIRSNPGRIVVDSSPCDCNPRYTHEARVHDNAWMCAASQIGKTVAELVWAEIQLDGARKPGFLGIKRALGYRYFVHFYNHRNAASEVVQAATTIT